MSTWTLVTSSSNCRGGTILVTCLGCLHSYTGEFHADISVFSFCSMTVQEVVFTNQASTPDISAVSPTYLPRRWLTVYKSVTHLSFRNLTSRFSNGRSSPAEKENKIFIWRQSTQVHTWEPHAGHRGGFSSSKIMPPLVLICESRQPGFHLFISCKRSLRIFFPEVGRGGCRGSGFCPCRGSASFMDKFVALKFLCYLLPSAATTDWCVSRPTLTVCWRVL